MRHFNKIVFAILSTVITGCIHQHSASNYSQLTSPSFLPEAENRLHDVTGSYIGMLGAVAYIAESPAYLVIEGEFDFEFGGVKTVFILRQEQPSDPWDKAEVYWIDSTSTNVDEIRNRVQRELLYPIELICLPEEDRMLLLKNFKTSPPDWYKRSVDRK